MDWPACQMRFTPCFGQSRPPLSYSRISFLNECISRTALCQSPKTWERHNSGAAYQRSVAALQNAENKVFTLPVFISQTVKYIIFSLNVKGSVMQFDASVTTLKWGRVFIRVALLDFSFYLFSAATQSVLCWRNYPAMLIKHWIFILYCISHVHVCKFHTELSFAFVHSNLISCYVFMPSCSFWFILILKRIIYSVLRNACFHI